MLLRATLWQINECGDSLLLQRSPLLHVQSFGPLGRTRASTNMHDSNMYNTSKELGQTYDKSAKDMTLTRTDDNFFVI